MRVGVLTGGGDAPGLNPAIKGLVYRGSELDLEVSDLFDGWRSLMNPLPDLLLLTRATVRRWDRDGERGQLRPLVINLLPNRVAEFHDTLKVLARLL
jgi:hypothetical protein